MTLWQAVAAALLVALTCAALKDGRERITPYIVAGGGILLAVWYFSRIKDAVTAFTGLAADTTLSPYLTLLLRAIGVGYTVKLGADTCRDLGAADTAAKLELCGKAELLMMALPYMAELIGLAVSLAGGET